MIVIDLIREARPPFSPEAVVDEFAALCRLYRITKITGDHFGGEFVEEPASAAWPQLRDREAAQEDPDLYRDLLPLLNSAASCCRRTTPRLADRRSRAPRVARRQGFD